MSDDDWAEEERGADLLVAIAHDGTEDCGYNVGRECDCSAPDGLAERLKQHRAMLVRLEVLDVHQPAIDHRYETVGCTCGWEAVNRYPDDDDEWYGDHFRKALGT